MEQKQTLTRDVFVRAKMNDGRDVDLRTIRPHDAHLIRAGISSLSRESRYLRFFSPAPMVPDSVLQRLVDVDGFDHIAWGAICADCDVETVIGVVRAVRGKNGGATAEYSVTVVDEYHGLGVARMLTAALLVDCLAAGITRLDVHMLSENRAAAGLIKSMGAVHRESSVGVSDYILDTQVALDHLRRDDEAPGVRMVLDQLRLNPA